MRFLHSPFSWLIGGSLSATLVLAACLPLAWVAPMAERATGHRLLVAAPHGSVWDGSARMGWRLGAAETWLPGRFAWRLSAAILAGDIRASVSNPQLGLAPVRISVNLQSAQVSAGSVRLPVQSLGPLHAAFEALPPGAALRLQWTEIKLALPPAGPGGEGQIVLRPDAAGADTQTLASLGTPMARAEFHPSHVTLTVDTGAGPATLSGEGRLSKAGLDWLPRSGGETAHEMQTDMPGRRTPRPPPTPIALHKPS